MPSYTAPVKDMQFVLHDVLKVSEAGIPGYGDLERDFTQAVLDEAGKLASQVLAALPWMAPQRKLAWRRRATSWSPRSASAGTPALQNGCTCWRGGQLQPQRCHDVLPTANEDVPRPAPWGHAAAPQHHTARMAHTDRHNHTAHNARVTP